MSFEIKNNVFWVGVIDWGLRKFHGEELSTNNGSSYNSYLIKDEKNVIIDTVYSPFSEEYINNLQKVIPLEKIDYIVINHAEPDHSGALPLLLCKAKNAKIVCSANGVKSIKGHFHIDDEMIIMKTGDTLNIGSRELVFVENQMIHWPDSMMCYLKGDNVLFSNDAFGQHLANKSMYNSKADKCLVHSEALKYYANIVTPFSKRVIKKIEEVIAMNLQIDFICPSHGVIWDENPSQIIELYSNWANSYQEDQVTIIYDTMYNSTRKMAEAIACGISEISPNTKIQLCNTGTSDKSDIITEIFLSKMLIAGSPTVNNGISTSLVGILEEIKGFSFIGKKGSAFGSYGWSPVGTKIIAEKLAGAGFELVGDGMKVNWNPDEKALEECKEYGKMLAKAL